MNKELENRIIEKGVDGAQKHIDTVCVLWFGVGFALASLICLIIKYKG